jgi:hypothetical protein
MCSVRQLLQVLRLVTLPFASPPRLTRRAQAYDERTGLTTKIKDTAKVCVLSCLAPILFLICSFDSGHSAAVLQDLNERLKISERSKAAADAASTAAASAAQAAKGAAASLAESAKAFNEKHKPLDKAKGLVAEASASVSSAAQRSGASDAIAGAGARLGSFFSRAGAAAGDALAAAKSRAAGEEAGVPVSTPALE